MEGWPERATPVAVAAVEREPTVADVTGGRGNAFECMFRDALLQDVFFWYQRGTLTAAPPVVALAERSIKRAAFGDKVLSNAVMRPTAEAAKVEQAEEMEMAVAVEVAQAVALELLDLQGVALL